MTTKSVMFTVKIGRLYRVATGFRFMQCLSINIAARTGSPCHLFALPIELESATDGCREMIF
jgi:hypothetical protein